MRRCRQEGQGGRSPCAWRSAASSDAAISDGRTLAASWLCATTFARHANPCTECQSTSASSCRGKDSRSKVAVISRHKRQQDLNP